MKTDKPASTETGPPVPMAGKRPSAWSSILASLAFSGSTFVMVQLYGFVHWRIMFDWDSVSLPRDGAPVFAVLDELGWMRLVFSLLAVTWAVWSFQGHPRWGAWLALGLAVVAAMTNFIIT